MSISSFGVRVFGSFAGKKDELKQAALGYFTTPVHIPIKIELLNTSDPDHKIKRDAMTIAVVNTDQKSIDSDIVTVSAKVISETKNITKIPVTMKGSTTVPVFRKGDDVILLVDTVYGDSVVLANIGKGGTIDLDDLTSVLSRFKSSGSLPESNGTPVTWTDFTGEGDSGDEGNSSGDNGDNGDEDNDDDAGNADNTEDGD